MIGTKLNLLKVQLLSVVLVFTCVLVAQGSQGSQGTDIFIVADGADANVQTISQVVLDVVDNDGMGMFQDTQDTPSTGTTTAVNSATLVSLDTAAGLLTDFNFATPSIENATFPTTLDIAVFTPTGAIEDTEAGFLDALAGTYSNGDLANYLGVDGSNGLAVWDVVYDVPLNTNDFLIFEERDGNTTFELQALDEDGDLIADGNTLLFNADSYQWSIGYSNEFDGSNAQPQVLGVIDFDLFGADEPIGGFRVTNTGRADFKFFVGALAVPEPATCGFIFLLSLPCLARRRR